MRLHWLPWIAAVVMLQVNTPAARTGVLAGRVVDGSGAAVAEAIVVVRPSGGSPGQANQVVPVRADSEGRFVFTNVPGGRFTMEVSKPGWLPGAFGRQRPSGASSEVTLDAGATRADLRVVLWRPAVIGGTVSGDDGEPVVGAEVQAVRLEWIAGRRVPSDQSTREAPRAKTDDRGVYRFTSLMPGDYVVAVLASAVSEPDTFAGAIRVSGETPRAFYQTMASGTVRSMTFDRASRVAGRGTLTRALSDLDGFATTYHPASLTMSGAETLSVASGDIQEAVNVQLARLPLVTVSGSVVDHEGPAAWHAVHLVATDTDDRPLVSTAVAVTDAQGRFVFAGVPPGEFIARVVRLPWPTDGDRYSVTGGTGAIPQISMVLGGPRAPAAPEEPAYFVNQQVSVGGTPIENVHLTLMRAPQLRGRVEFVGGAQPGATDRARARVLVEPAGGGRADANLAGARPNESGEFLASTIWPGRYVVKAIPPPGWYFKGATLNGRDVTDAALEVDEDVSGVVVTFVDRERRLAGTVQGDRDTPPGAAAVILFPVEARARVDHGRAPRTLQMIAVGADGRFSVSAPPAGDYFVVAVPVADADDWKNPAQLQAWSALADRVTIADTPSPITLRVRSLR